jgi:hypothetical protein
LLQLTKNKKVKTYKKIHESKEIANKHIAKIKERGGKVKHSVQDGKTLLEYSFTSDDVKNGMKPKLRVAKEFGEIIGLTVNARGNVIIDGKERDMLEMMKDLFNSINEYSDNDIDNAVFTIESFELNESKINDKVKFGRKVNSYLNGVAF